MPSKPDEEMQKTYNISVIHHFPEAIHHNLYSLEAQKYTPAPSLAPEQTYLQNIPPYPEPPPPPVPASTPTTPASLQ